MYIVFLIGSSIMISYKVQEFRVQLLLSKSDPFLITLSVAGVLEILFQTICKYQKLAGRRKENAANSIWIMDIKSRGSYFKISFEIRILIPKSTCKYYFFELVWGFDILPNAFIFKLVTTARWFEFVAQNRFVIINRMVPY